MIYISPNNFICFARRAVPLFFFPSCQASMISLDSATSKEFFSGAASSWSVLMYSMAVRRITLGIEMPERVTCEDHLSEGHKLTEYQPDVDHLWVGGVG